MDRTSRGRRASNQARDFAKATGRLAKTDRIDAEALAHFAEAVRPEPRPAATAERQALDALLSRRGQLVEMRTMESNRLGTCRDAAVRAGIERHLAWLDAELAEAERRLDAAVKASPAWRERDELLRGIPGIGPVVSRTLLASLPELGAPTARGWRPWSGWRRTPTTAARSRGPAHPRRAGRHATGDVPGGPVGGAPRRAAEGVRRPAAVAGQEGQGGPDRGRPQAADDRQRRDPLGPALETGAGDGA